MKWTLMAILTLGVSYASADFKRVFENCLADRNHQIYFTENGAHVSCNGTEAKDLYEELEHLTNTRNQTVSDPVNGKIIGKSRYRGFGKKTYCLHQYEENEPGALTGYPVDKFWCKVFIDVGQKQEKL